MNEKDFMTVAGLVKRGGVLEPLYNASYSIALSGICMILEEFSKKQGEDVLETATKVHIAVKEVNKELGKY